MHVCVYIAALLICAWFALCVCVWGGGGGEHVRWCLSKNINLCRVNSVALNYSN